jgi:hypothetical protein
MQGIRFLMRSNERAHCSSFMLTRLSQTGYDGNLQQRIFCVNHFFVGVTVGVGRSGGVRNMNRYESRPK